MKYKLIHVKWGDCVESSNVPDRPPSFVQGVGFQRVGEGCRQRDVRLSWTIQSRLASAVDKET